MKYNYTSSGTQYFLVCKNMFQLNRIEKGIKVQLLS